MKRSWFALALVFGLGLAPLPAHAEDAPEKVFLKNNLDHIRGKLKETPSSKRDQEILGGMARLFDYDTMTRTIFGDPCPRGMQKCNNSWSNFSEEQRSELRSWFRKIVEKRQRKNLMDAVDYSVEYTSVSGSSPTRVQMTATPPPERKKSAVSLSYFIVQTDGAYRVVDIQAEGSSTVKNYYTQLQGKSFEECVKALKKAHSRI